MFKTFKKFQIDRKNLFKSPRSFTAICDHIHFNSKYINVKDNCVTENYEESKQTCMHRKSSFQFSFKHHALTHVNKPVQKPEELPE